MTNFVITEVIRTMKELQAYADQQSLPKLKADAVRIGLERSDVACEQKKEVAMTPLMKNMLTYYGDITVDPKTGKHTRLTIDRSEHTKTQKALAKIVSACLQEQGGKERTEYDETKPLLDKIHYFTDCCIQNKFKEGSSMWDIAEGQSKQRDEMVEKYETPTAWTTARVIAEILRNPVLQKSIEVLYHQMKDVVADPELHEVAMAFQAKDSGTSYPEYHHDTTVMPGSDETWGKHELQETIKLTKNMSEPENVLEYNVDTAYARNQRTKGRLIIAKSRRYNIVVYSLEGPEMETYKNEPGYVGLLDDVAQKQNMEAIVDFCIANDCVCRNWDQSAYDVHIGQGWACLIAALRAMHCKGKLAQLLAKIRYNGINRSWLIYGPNSKPTIMYGRTPSGYIDTTLQNTHLSNLGDLFANMMADKSYTNDIVFKAKVRGEFLGDDILSVSKKGINPEDYSKAWESIGFETNMSKAAFGPFFLQYRLFEDEEGKRVMVYPWTRVLRSMLSKEETKGLGPIGWEVAFWQQLSKLIDYKPALQYVLNILLPFDPYGFCLDKDVNWIKDQIRIEDQEAKQKKKNAKTTAEILNANNPQQGRQFDAKSGAIDFDYFAKVQAALKECVIPHFYEKFGLKTPKINQQ